jgi:sialidase-1
MTLPNVAFTLLNYTSTAISYVSSATPPSNPCTDATCVPVFYPGLNGSECYRIPTIIKTHTGTLLAFSENRLNGCGDQGTHNLVVRRSADSGHTWGPLITVVVGETPCPGCPAAVSNPNPVEVTLGNGTRALLLAFDTMNNPSAAHHGLDKTVWSFDDGLTWERATTLAYPPEVNSGSLIGPTVGLQADEGTIFFWITEGFLIFSRDGGASWSASVQTAQRGECSIAWAVDSSNSTLVMNCRSGKDHRRGQLYWRPSGTTYEASAPTYPDELTDPGCQGSILNVAGTLYTSNAASTTARERMTIHRSADGGASWSDGQARPAYGAHPWACLTSALGGHIRRHNPPGAGNSHRAECVLAACRLGP